MVALMQANHVLNINNGPRQSPIDRGIWVTPNEKRLLAQSQSLPEDWVYDNIRDAIYHCRRIYYIYLGILCYTLLTILTTPTLHFFKEQIIIMPFMDAPMPLNYYLGIAPLLLIGFFIYKQLYLYKTNKLIRYAVDECKSINNGNCGECRDKDRDCNLNNLCNRHLSRLYPWIIIFCRFVEQRHDRKDKKDGSSLLVGRFQQVFVSFSLWWLLPIILLLLSLFVIKKHSYTLSIFMLAMTSIGIVVTTIFWYHQQKITDQSGSIFTPVRKAFIAASACSVLVLSGLNMVAFNGKLPWYDKHWEDEDMVPLMTSLIRDRLFADLRKETFAAKPTKRLTDDTNRADMQKQSATHSVGDQFVADDKPPGIDLDGRHFEGANLSEATLTKASMKSANLNSTYLVAADLRLANLFKVRANEANFTEAKLHGAKFEQMNAIKPIFSDAKLFDAEFINATLIEADFAYADIVGANFSGSNLEGAKFINADLKRAIFRSAVLLRAVFKQADITDAEFVNANLQYANLQLAKGMQADQIKSANNYQLAYYDPEWLEALGLPYNNNDRVKAKSFHQYFFKNAKLINADFRGADLTKAQLNNADLKNADLQDANITGAVLLNANFQNANLKAITYSDIDQFAAVKTIYEAKMDSALKDELERRYPHLFAQP